ncbi:MAG: hypothetical protein FJX73_10415 [Armatimonadetes bacterium]|nr:hypothetical protein [Armatimonadota bacterium]
MKRISLLVLLVGISAVAASCRAPGQRGGGIEPLIPQPSPRPAIPVVVEVFGTSGLRFEGSYGELGESKRAGGAVPASIAFQTVEGFSVTLQKRTDTGELGIQVTVAGKPVHRSSTTREFGLVTYTHRVSSP